MPYNKGKHTCFYAYYFKGGFMTHQFNGSAGVAGGTMIKTLILSAGGAAATAIVYDGTDATGEYKCTIHSIQDDSTVLPNVDISFNTGIYVTLSGTGANLDAIVK